MSIERDLVPQQHSVPLGGRSSKKIMTRKLHIVVVAFTAWMLLACVWLYAGNDSIPDLLKIAFMHSWRILYFMGAAICVIALISSKRKAYLVFLIYFALAFYSVTGAHYVNTFVADRFFADLTISDKQRSELDREIADVYSRHDMQRPLVLNLPMGQVLLLFGIWIMARKDIEHAPPECLLRRK